MKNFHTVRSYCIINNDKLIRHIIIEINTKNIIQILERGEDRIYWDNTGKYDIPYKSANIVTVDDES
jgi:hypothetical protein